MIRCYRLTRSYSNQEILTDITFSVREGERVSILGPGGSGKSTILKMIIGVDEPNSGYAQLMGVDLFKGSFQERKKVLCRVGVAFQQGGLFDFMTVRENLLFVLDHMTKMSSDIKEDCVKDILSAVKLGNTGDLYPHQMSGGMRRRVGIARALCTNPQIAIFDEPTAGLDPVTSSIILNRILKLATDEKKSSMLVATSNVEIAIRFAERILIVKEGRVVADGPWRELLTSGSDWMRNFLETRLIGLSRAYVEAFDLPESFLKKHWEHNNNHKVV